MVLVERRAGESFLLVEDDANDAAFVIRCFRKAKVLNPVHWVTTGEEALEYLNGAGKYGDRQEFPFPSLVLLDLNLPRISGFEVLTRLRKNPAMSGLRVVILSTSSAQRDVTKAYELGANSYLVKTLDFERFCEITSALGGSWCWFSAPVSEGREKGVDEGRAAKRGEVSRER